MPLFSASSGSGNSGKRRSFAEEIQFIKRVDGCHFKIKKGFVEKMQVDGCFYVNRHLEKLMFDELRHHVSAAGVGGFLPGSRCLTVFRSTYRTHEYCSHETNCKRRCTSWHCSGEIALTFVQKVVRLAAIGLILCVQASIGLPDVHSGYGFAIGNVAACELMQLRKQLTCFQFLVHVHKCSCSSKVLIFRVDCFCAVDMSNPKAVVSPGGVGFDINCGVRLLRTNLSEKQIAPVSALALHKKRKQNRGCRQ